ncbi:hypothetical protein C7S14_0051 [Burkholderia cepacia]|nr:hypothetical protein [Burkholderia cepacia]QOH38200.1 hypothetical protein C7S14_0051 [Burkholderia cepacia]
MAACADAGSRNRGRTVGLDIDKQKCDGRSGSPAVQWVAA